VVEGGTDRPSGYEVCEGREYVVEGGRDRPSPLWGGGDYHLRTTFDIISRKCRTFLRDSYLWW
jgi:hypothetical protein